MSNIYLYILLALAAGAMLPTQAAANNRLADFVNGPVLAALVSFVVGTLALLVYTLASGAPLGSILLVKNASPTAWIGGFLGAFFVTATIMLVPRLGVAMTFSLIIAGQMLMTLVIDHFGLFGIEERTFNLPRLFGIALITTGVILIRKF